jgi:hypothetical protein
MMLVTGGPGVVGARTARALVDAHGSGIPFNPNPR